MDIYFSVIIPTLNEEYNLPILLNALSKQTFRNFEVIVSDSGSKDKTEIYANSFRDKIPHFKFIKYPTKNVSAARNNGASLAQANWLVFFDSDVEPAPDFLNGIKKHIEKNSLDMLTVWNRPKTKNLNGIITLGLLNVSMTLLQKIKPAANGPCIIIKKQLFEQIGKFDDTIVFGEDFDLSQKAHKKGARFAVFSTPVLYVSARRFDKEGIGLSIYKSVKAIWYQIVKGPIRKPLFEYKMGGHNFKEHDQEK